MSPTHRTWLLVSTLVVAVLGIGIYGLNAWHKRQMVAGILNLPDTPQSISGVQCDGPAFTTDTLNTCAFMIDPADFEPLLRGWQFTAVTSHFNLAHDFPSAYNQGPNFAVSYQYIAEPKVFSHGGMVFVFTDADRRHVLTHLYVE